MNENSTRNKLQQDIDSGKFLGQGLTVNLNIPSAPIVSSHKQGLASKDYIVFEQKDCSNSHFQGQWNDVIFDKCTFNSSKLSGNFHNVNFMYCNLSDANFTEVQNLTPEQVYTSTNLDHATFPDDKNFKKSLSALIEADNQVVQHKQNTSSILAQLTGDISETINDYSKKVLGYGKEVISSSVESISNITTPSIQIANKKSNRSL